MMDEVSWSLQVGKGDLGRSHSTKLLTTITPRAGGNESELENVCGLGMGGGRVGNKNSLSGVWTIHGMEGMGNREEELWGRISIHE